ncbi:MAG: D-TA family PLP-dependent enzyme [Gammaproteobacteria bacterium]|nr:D-TA family PLP-dependent enzyme [Gammaproteobacteria bacterium]
MDPRHRIDDTSELISPALVFFEPLIRENLAQMIRIAGGAKRLRPHCKTHKTDAITRIELSMGITRHKCATLAEAEMLAEAGVRDVFLAYNLVGPNITRAVRFLRRYPRVRLSVSADHHGPIDALAKAMRDAGLCIDVLLDIDSGQHRTGVAPGTDALALYQRIVDSEGLNAAGLHLYDGHNHQRDPAERRAAVMACWQDCVGLRDRLLARGWPVPGIVAGGTGSFPVFAGIDDPTLELSPGTCVLHDAGYADDFPDMRFANAAMILTRVVSKPGTDIITLDLGTKACAADPPAGHRLSFPTLPDAVELLHNEEHLVLRSEGARDLLPGDELLAIPRHICPTSALHKAAFVVRDGQLIDRWPISARDRWLSL